MNQHSPDRHYTEADLLETYYTQPGASMPVMMHLADCTDCASRYERLEAKVRGLAACGTHDGQPDSFWARQRISVMRRIESQKRTSMAARVSRIAAAAALVVGLGGWFTLSRTPEPPAIATTTTIELPAEPSLQATTPADPWDSEELGEFHSIVAWESWDDQTVEDNS